MIHQFNLSDDERPKRFARLLQAEFARLGIATSLSKCLDIAAELYEDEGANWKRLKPSIGRGKASPLDHETDDVVVESRRAHHERILVKHGIPASEISSVLDRLRPTSSWSTRRVEDTTGRFTYLDLTTRQLRPLEPEEQQLYATLFTREAVSPAYASMIDWGSRQGRLLRTTGPAARQALCTRLAELNARTFLAPVVLASTLMRFEGEPMIWADSIKELERRLGEPVTLRRWAESDFMAGGFPTEEGIKEAIIMRNAAMRSVGHPVHRYVVKNGEIGFLVNEYGKRPFSIRLPVRHVDEFERQMTPLVTQVHPRALHDVDSFLKAQVDVFQSYWELENGPSVDLTRLQTTTAGFLLWLAFHRPDGVGRQLKDRAIEMASAGGTACIVFTLTRDKRFMTSLGPDYADIPIDDLPTEVIRAAAATLAQSRTKED